MADFEAVLLTAGMGTRLGRPHPKTLTTLATGETILRRQIDYVRGSFGSDLRVTAVVGFKLEQIIEASPDIGFVYNPYFDTTNTNRSLLAALRLTGPVGILWMNGDVVFDRRLLSLLEGHLDRDKSFVAVNTASVAEEEVKYTLDEAGHIDRLAKTVPVDEALGEAVGINYVSRGDKASLIRRLAECEEQDYFERGIELAIQHDRMEVEAVDISRFPCIEVDMQADLDQANDVLGAADA